jgi:methionyl aminopeptidase
MIKIKSPEEIAQMQRLGKIASSVLRNLIKTTSAGISTKDIEENARLLIDKFKVRSAFLGYKGFPGLLCVSLNEELIHGIPSPGRIVKKGDLVSLDLGLYNGSFFTDTAYSFSVGKPSRIAQELLSVGRKALAKAIKMIRPKVFLGDVSWTIQNFVESQGFCVVKQPMVTVESSEVEILDDGWTVVSKDRKPCVHFEHTVAVTRGGARILTN